jgi:SOS-response transcriptional repressor LexA
MERGPDEKREVLRRFIVERGLKPGPWAKQSGVSVNSLYNFLNNHSDGLEPITYAKLARQAQVPVWRLTGELPEAPSPTSMWVSGTVEAGAFREAIEWDRSLWYSVDVPVPVRFRGKARALETRGPSMNRVYPEGTIIIWVPMLDFRTPRDGDRVVVYAHRTDGTIEATVKKLVEADGRRWLWPESDHPLHQAPLDVTEPDAGISHIEIEGIVIGSYKPEHH